MVISRQRRRSRRNSRRRRHTFLRRPEFPARNNGVGGGEGGRAGVGGNICIVSPSMSVGDATSASRDLGVAMATFRIMQASRCLIGASHLSRGTTESEVHSVSDVTLRGFVAFRLSVAMCYMA